MATSGGARTTSFGNRIGTLDIGKAADLILLDWNQLLFPYLDAILQRAEPGKVRHYGYVCRRIIYQDGRFAPVDRD